MSGQRYSHYLIDTKNTVLLLLLLKKEARRFPTRKHFLRLNTIPLLLKLWNHHPTKNLRKCNDFCSSPLLGWMYDVHKSTGTTYYTLFLYVRMNSMNRKCYKYLEGKFKCLIWFSYGTYGEHTQNAMPNAT